ncbi:MAG: tripartite tricarboxylate transporter substrate binding protein [Thermodesulfobacteriota bacterium]
MLKKNYLIIFVMALLVSGIIQWGSPQPATAKYPEKPIMLVCPFNPGGGADLTARAFASTAPKYLGQSVVVVNKAGASGSVAHNAFKNEKPDGYTLIITGNSPSTVFPYIEKVNYDPVNDFEFLGRLTNLHNVIVVKKDAPWNTIQEFFAYAKANPGKLKVGTSGANSLDDLFVRMMNQELGIELVGVGFEASSEGNMAVLGGHIQANNCAVLTPLPLIKSGSMKALVITSDSRDPSLPDTPTLIELGINLSLNNSIGIAAPKGTPKEIRDFLEDAIKKTFEDPGYKGISTKLGLTPDYLNGEDFKKVTAAEGAKVKKIVGK